MKKYANLHGDSGVDKYSITGSSIKVKFRESNKIYVYDYTQTGQVHVDKMISFAELGRGLSTYIAKNKKILRFSIEY